MKESEDLKYLIEVAEKLGFKVFVDRILSSGGTCRIYRKRYIVINKNLSDSFKKKLLIEILRDKIDKNVYLEPKIKKMLGIE